MAFWWGLILIGVVVLAIWLLIELKRFRHKIFALFLILLILFGYLSFVFVFKGRDVDYKTFSGLIEAGKIYFSWLGSITDNVKAITVYSVKLDWKANNTDEKEKFSLW